jgi:hypothetical protein
VISPQANDSNKTVLIARNRLMEQIPSLSPEHGGIAGQRIPMPPFSA